MKCLRPYLSSFRCNIHNRKVDEGSLKKSVKKKKWPVTFYLKIGAMNILIGSLALFSVFVLGLLFFFFLKIKNRLI